VLAGPKLCDDRQMNFARALGLSVRALALGFFAVFFAGPLVWLLLAPTRTGYDLATGPAFAFGSLGNIARTWHQLDAFGDHLFRRWMENSILYALSATALTLLTSIPAGYGLAVGRFRGRRLLLSVTVVAMTMPATALVLPIFLELNAAHLLGSAATVVLPFAFFPFGVFLAYLYYSTALPPMLLEAARIDGCGEWATFRRVALPLAKPLIALVFFFSFTADWTNFFLPYVLLPGSSQYPVEVGLSDMLVGAPKPELALAAVIATAPLALVFVASQRAIVRGLLAGASTG
jgi:multiple sugar transport system permease protein